MKRNVDLTENMLFSRSTMNSSLSNLMKKSMCGNFPWVSWSGLSDVGSQHDRIIVCGNKHDREFVSEYHTIISMNNCDCCGASLIKYPWERTYGLCRKCQEYYDKREKMFGWEFKPE